MTLDILISRISTNTARVVLIQKAGLILAVRRDSPSLNRYVWDTLLGTLEGDISTSPLQEVT